MAGLPTREALASLYTAVAAVVPVQSLGVVESRDDACVEILLAHSNGVSDHVILRSEMPAVLRPLINDASQDATTWIGANPDGAVEWLLALGGVRRVVSFAVPNREPVSRVWIGLTQPDAIEADRLLAVQKLVHSHLNELWPTTADEATEPLRRLEETAHLLPALLHVLDVREVFDRLSVIARRALSHDLLVLRIFSDDLTTVTTYASSERGTDVGTTIRQSYPAAVTRSWQFDIIDDVSNHPLERDQPQARLGLRSVLRLPIRFGDRVIGGIGFLSFAPAKYTIADVAIGRRLADYVAVGLSHHQLAEEGRQAAALRERATNLEMLDGLLKALTGVLDIREVFDRVSEIAQKVLPHDALSIAEMLPPGEKVRIHASHGLGDLPNPYDVRIPDPTVLLLSR